MMITNGPRPSSTSRAVVRRCVQGALATVVLGLNAVSCGIRDDELLCEEALAQLQRCCHTAVPVHCHYERGCEYVVVPDIDAEAAECILSRECDQISEGSRCTAVERSITHQDHAGTLAALQCP